MKKSIVILSLLLTAFLQSQLYAAVKTSAQSGLFLASSTWVGGVVPAPYDDIIISAGHTVTLNANVTVFNITIQAGATLDNATYRLTIDRPNVGNPTYNNNGVHNGTGYLVAYDDYKTEITGNGETNCSIEIDSYGLALSASCNLTINGNIQHASPGNFGMNGKILIEANTFGASLTVNGDIITDSIYGGVGIENMAATITVNGNVNLPGSSDAGAGGILRNHATFNISGNLLLGPYFSYCANFGNMVIGGDLLGASEDETYFLQGVNSVVKFGGQVFPDSNPGYLDPLRDEYFGSAEPNTIEYNGTIAQVIEYPANEGIYSNLVINNGSSEGVTISSDIILHGNLTLSDGLLSIGDFNLWLGDTTLILGTPSSASMVVATGTGELKKAFTTDGSFSFPVGDNNEIPEYAPVTVNFTSGTYTDAYVGVNLVNQPYPGVTGSYLNRYWNISSTGITGFSCDAHFNYVSEDVTGIEDSVYCFRVTPTEDIFDITNTTLHQLTATALTSFGTFTGKQQNSLPLPLEFEVTGGGVYCVGEEGLPVGLSGSELGVLYTLYKDNIAQDPALYGTGTPLTFGNQLFGNYTVIGSSDAGDSPMTGEAIIVEDTLITPTASIFVNSDVVCDGTELTVTSLTTGGGNAPHYQWLVNGTEIGGDAPELTYTPLNNDEIVLVFTSSASCAIENPVTSNSIIIEVNALPEVTWSAFEPDTLCQEDWGPVALSGGLPVGGTYSGDGVIDNSFDPALAGIGNHEITYTFSDANGCSNQASLILFVDVCQGTTEIESGLMVYPNPVSDYLKFKTTDRESIKQITLSNLFGTVLFQNDDPKANMNVSIPVMNFPPGSYLLRIVYTNKILIRTIIVQ